jgi:hypothetical protein
LRDVALFSLALGEDSHMAEKTRAGTATSLTLDDDAMQLLRQMAPGRKKYGTYVSSLLRSEAARQEERRRAKEAAMHAIEMALCS